MGREDQQVQRGLAGPSGLKHSELEKAHQKPLGWAEMDVRGEVEGLGLFDPEDEKDKEDLTASFSYHQGN